MKSKPFKPACPWIKKEQAAHRRALAAPQRVQNGFEPAWRTPFGMKTELARVIYLYAAALGQKRGQLPENLSQWNAVGQVLEGNANITFYAEGEPASPVTVALRNLAAWPEPPVEETEPEWTEPMKEAA